MNKDNPLASWLPWIAAAALPMGGAMAYLLGMLKEKTMTPMEKAFAQLLRLLLGKLEEQDAELTKLRGAPAKESYDRLLKENTTLLARVEKLENDLQHMKATVPAKRGKRS